MKFIAKALMAAAVCTAALQPLTASAQNKVLFNIFLQRQVLVNQEIIMPWLEEVSKATEGRVVFEVPPSSLNAPQQQYEGVVKGMFDMSYMFNGFLTDRIKLTQVAQLPFVSTDPAANSVALWRTHEKFFAQANEYKDVHLLGLFVLPPGELFSMKDPIRNIEDLKGKKIYSNPGPHAQMLTEAGAAVVAAPAARSYEIISGGTVDAFAGYSSVEAGVFKTLQYAKSITEIPGYLNAPSFSLFISKKKWASISEKDRETITRMSGAALAKRFDAYTKAIAKQREENRKAGIQYVAASDKMVADLKRLAAPVEAAWIADTAKLGVDGKAALEFYRSESLKRP